ncbi:MAG: D-alanyl-D-alanine carboxypeptidase [Oscillospiraceae bacterium]|nr:D-alanyl-D-alanine carboxypeptidase [Oscillospiraceae bacterium]
MSFVAFTASATATELPEVAVSSCYGIDANSALLGDGKLVDNIRAGILYEANSQTLMYTFEADKAMSPASLVKIMTALIALEKGQLQDNVVVSDEALSAVPIDAVSAKLQIGEQMKLVDLLYCMMVGSANDAASVIAEHISGNQEAFVAVMNQYAQELGCTGTTFINPHGLHDDQQVTTARDVARILDKALKNEQFKKIFTAKTYTVEATNMSNARKLATGNSLVDTSSGLYYDNRVIGGRTGVAGDGRRCLAAVAEANGMLLISVVMGAESVYQEDGYSAISVGGYKETSKLLDAGLQGYKTAQVLYANQPLQQCKVENGDCDLVIGPGESVSSVLPVEATVNNLTYHYTVGSVQAPVAKGDKITTLQVWSGGLCVAETDLYALNSVQRVQSIAADISDEEGPDNGSAVVIFTVVGIVAAALMAVAALKFLPVLSARRRSMRHRRNRKRS